MILNLNGFYLLELLPDDLNNISAKKLSPKACQKLIWINPNISGINQFHNHIVGKASNKAYAITKTAPTKILVKISICCILHQRLIINIKSSHQQVYNNNLKVFNCTTQLTFKDAVTWRFIISFKR